MLLGTLGASLLGNLLTGKGIMRAGDGIVRAGSGSKKKKLKFFVTFSSFNLDLMVCILEIIYQKQLKKEHM